jgi:hypothetical protein
MPFDDEIREFGAQRTPASVGVSSQGLGAVASIAVPQEIKGSPSHNEHRCASNSFILDGSFSEDAGSRYSPKFLHCGKNDIFG